MPALTSHEKAVCPSVRPSVVKPVDCDKTKETCVNILIPMKDNLS